MGIAAEISPLVKSHSPRRNRVKSTHPHATARTVDKMKEIPRAGDRVEFRCRGLRIGTVIAVAETEAHFLVEVPFTRRMMRKPWDSECKRLRVGLDAIIRILPSARS